MVQFLSLSPLKFPKLVANFSWDFKAFVLTILSFPTLRLNQGSRVQNFQLRVSNGGYKDHFGKYIYYIKLQLPSLRT